MYIIVVIKHRTVGDLRPSKVQWNQPNIVELDGVEVVLRLNTFDFSSFIVFFFFLRIGHSNFLRNPFRLFGFNVPTACDRCCPKRIIILCISRTCQRGFTRTSARMLCTVQLTAENASPLLRTRRDVRYGKH